MHPDCKYCGYSWRRVLSRDTDGLRYIGKGWEGWHGGAKNWTLTGYGRDAEETSVWWACQHAQPTLAAQCMDGALAYDASEADRDAWQAWIIRGPMIRPDIDGADEGFGSLDYVSLTTWIRTAKARVPGLRTGVVQDGRIEWAS